MTMKRSKSSLSSSLSSSSSPFSSSSALWQRITVTWIVLIVVCSITCVPSAVEARQRTQKPDTAAGSSSSSSSSIKSKPSGMSNSSFLARQLQTFNDYVSSTKNIMLGGGDTKNNKKDGNPYLYFLAGALLPTLAYAFLNVHEKRKRRRGNRKTGADGSSSSNAQQDGDNPVLDESDSDDDDGLMFLMDKAAAAGRAPACAAWSITDAPYKMVLCVNTDLPMGKGKVAAQCAHAALGCYKRAARTCPTALRAWERTGCAKIALKCPEDQLELVAALAMSQDIPAYLVEDAGRTQIAAGSRTVLGLFGPVHIFTGVTDHLKLM